MKKKLLLHNAPTETGLQGSLFSFVWSWKMLALVLITSVISDTLF